MEDRRSREVRSILLNPGDVLQSRYRISHSIGTRKFLAEDLNRYNERCVLQEFVPQLEGIHVLKKARELFERKAGILYRLQHPQIPQFRQLFYCEQDKEHLFLVQDYVAGETYYALLDQRIQADQKFSEVEIKQLLIDVLPILEYVHSMGIIHRNISPNSLILRNSDKLPVLIGLGCIKEVEIEIQSELLNAIPSVVTAISKIDYAPPEQVGRGILYAHSDLYALAATAVVLLTGKEPQQLVDHNNLCWQWQSEVAISSKLEWVLSTMLSPSPSDRFGSATEVIKTLQDISVTRISQPIQAKPKRHFERQTFTTKIATQINNIPSKSLIFGLFAVVLILGGYFCLTKTGQPEDSSYIAPVKNTRQNSIYEEKSLLAQTTKLFLSG